MILFAYRRRRFHWLALMTVLFGALFGALAPAHGAEAITVVLDQATITKLPERVATIVEGPAADEDMAQFALIEARGAGRLAFGGLFEGARTLAVLKTPRADEALAWLGDTGFWKRDALAARPWLHVL